MRFTRFQVGKICTLGALAAVACITSGASAAVITWNTPTTVSADSDVSTAGSLVNAYIMNGGTGSSTVNTVPFNYFGSYVSGNSVTNGNYSISSALGLANYNGFGSFNSASTNYTQLLTDGIYATSGEPLHLTLGGLTHGQNYLVQLWVNDARTNTPVVTGRYETFSGDNSSISNSVNYNTVANGAVTGPGQFIIGTFTADSSGSQVVTMNPGDYITPGDANSQLNAFQLRAVSAAVPEPAPLYLVALGGLGLLLLARRKMV